MAYGVVAWDNPDWFSYKGPSVQRSEIVPIVTGTAWSSHAPGSIWFSPVNLDSPVSVSNAYVFKSFNAVVPQATSANSSGSDKFSYGHTLFVYKRQDWSANSTNLSFLTSVSGGLTATLSYSSGSQSMGLSWATNSTGGTSGMSTTSGAGNWSGFLTGPKVMPIPWVSTLSAGEYFFGHQHSSTTATSNSNVTLLSASNLHVAPQILNYGILGNSGGTVAYMGAGGIGLGAASAVTTNATMAGSVISASVVNLWVQDLSNA